MSDDILRPAGAAFSVKALPGSTAARMAPKSADKLEQACKDFESLFINQMMQQMRKTVPQDGLFNGGRAEKIYTEMLDSEMAKSIANQRGMGLASILYRQLSTLAADEKPEDPK